jgi:Tetratricopeptide repeat
MRSVGARIALASSVVGGVLALSGVANAQVATPSAVEREQLGTISLSEQARARARRGDCAGALTVFDEAIKTTTDPTLRRDRGLCHEKLDDPYPAVDDFRAYLTARPDAPDSDDIRDRLGRLEARLGLGGPANGAKHASTSDDDPFHGPKASTATHYDSTALEESDDSSPLRRGTGAVLSGYIGVRRWFAPTGGGSSAGLWAETAGLRLGYSMTETSSILFEIGYERFNQPASSAITTNGLSLQLGYEARAPVRGIDNNFIFGLSAGFDQLFNATNAVAMETVPNDGALYGRLRLGYRHNFGPGAALELDLDGGIGGTFIEASVPPGTSTSQTIGLVGLDLALAFGL